ncbi:hypothetical protein [Solibacillus isronensis]|uniref:hypothetical protein n=1 Tax=Solibacillus isronensis TaxID=412383 RepID=UPI0009A77A7A|nr:hypothetical protein [Solibacillus isronensis]
MLKPLVAIAGLYIVLVLLDLAQGTNYKHIYSDFIMEWWQVLLALYILPAVLKVNRKYKYKVFDTLRLKQFKAENKRFRFTSEMSSLLTLYLLEPPRAHNPELGFIASDKFYKEVVTAFHEKLANASRATKSTPDKRAFHLLIIGPKLLIRHFIYLVAPFAWIFYVKLQLQLTFISDWPVITLPVVIALFLRTVYFVQANIVYSPIELNKKLVANDMNESTPLHTVLPNTALGNEIVSAQKVEAEYRQRCSFISRNIPIPEHVEPFRHIYFPHEIYPTNIKLNTSQMKPVPSNHQQVQTNDENTAQESLYASVVTIKLG